MKKSFSIWSAFDVEASPEETVDRLAARGMTECELSDEHGAMLLERAGTPEAIGAAFRDYAAAKNVTFPQGHLFLRVRLCDPATKPVETLSRWIRLFGAIGIRNAVLHPDYRTFSKDAPMEELIEQNAAVLKQLAPVAEQCGVRICLENMRLRFGDVKDLLKLIECVDSPALGICLDTGHLNIAHTGSQRDFILAAGEKLHAIHLADNEGENDQHMMPFGRGNVDFVSVFRTLEEIGYNDLLNYEIPGERCPLELRAAKTAYVREINDYLLGMTGK